MLHFVLGRKNSGKTSHIIDKVESRREAGTLFLVPEQYSHSTERLLCSKCGNSVSGFAEVISFKRLATKVKSEYGGLAAEMVDGARRILMLYSAVRSQAPSLCVLGRTATRTENLGELLSAIDEFKAYGISPEKLISATDSLTENCGRKIRDLALIYAAYEGQLSENEFDAYDELAYVAESLRKNDFWKGKTLYVDGFSGFTSAEFDILGSAMSRCRDVFITLTLPENVEEGMENGIFDKAWETKKRLIHLAEKSGCEYDEIFLPKSGEGVLSHLDEAVFSDTVRIFEGDASEICFARADSVFEECELAAAYILDHVKSGGRFRDFSVAVTDTEEYAAICESVFSRYGIPSYMSIESELLSKPPVALILSALECIIYGFKNSTVMEYLKTGFSGVCARSLDIFENYLYTWAPKQSEWAKGEDFTHNPFGLSAEQTPESEETLRVVNCARRKVFEPIEELSRAIEKGKTGEKCAEALYDFINKIGLPRRLAAAAYLERVGGRFAVAQEYEALMEILCGVFDSIGRSAENEEVGARELYHLFGLVVAQEKLSTIPATLDCVSISELSQALGERPRIRIILGAQEGVFPRGKDSAGLLSDSDREELLDFGIELAPCMADRIFEEYRTVHGVICSGEEGLYISSCALDGRGEENQESHIVARLRKIYPDAKTGLTVSEARLRARIPCFDESVAGKKNYSFWEKDEQYSEKLASALKNYDGKRGPITDRENIEAVFGKKIFLSASKAETFASCRYAYFLKYGLHAERREKAEVSPLEAGSLMHYVLEKVISTLSEEGNFDTERALVLSGEACREYVEETFRGTQKLPARTQFLIKRLEKTVRDAVSDVCTELSKGEFLPSKFELKFAIGEDSLPPIEIRGERATVLLRGAVDRVDTYEHNGKLYFRVIDYKSGKKEFAVDEAINGIGMQMLLYMFAIEEMAGECFGRDATPCGVMYVPIARELSIKRGELLAAQRREGVVLRDMQIIDAMEKGEEKIYIPVSIGKKGEIKKSSVVLKASEFDAVKERMRGILSRIGDELVCGEIEPNPYEHKNESSCRFCEYKSVCAFDDVRGKDRKRELIEVRLKDILDEDGGEEDEQNGMDS